MQPNQQDPYQSNLPAQQNENIPEYLHMEPIVNTTLSRNNLKRKIILLLAGLILLGSFSAAGYWYIQQSSLQSRLYKAFENALSVKYVNEKTTYHKDGTGKGTNVEIDSTVDLSDPSNVSSESTINFSRQIKRNGAIANDEYSIRLIKREQLNLYVKSYSGKSDLNGLDKKKWIATNSPKGNIDSRLEEFDVSTIIYGTQFVPIMGNYDSVLRSKIMDTIRSDNMYKVVDTTSKNIGGESIVGIRVGVNRKAINKLNKMITAQTKSDTAHNLLGLINDANYEDIIVWINSKDTVVGVDYHNGLDKNHIRITNKKEFTYLDEANINEPNK
ncbi:MAG: hypothetical protein WAW80_05075 [Candidatus Saccharimonadales bacterium]